MIRGFNTALSSRYLIGRSQAASPSPGLIATGG